MSGTSVGFISSYSIPGIGTGGTAGYVWRKSSHSVSGAGQCVEVAARPRAVHVRDSKNIGGPVFGVAPGAWTAFVAYAAEQAEQAG
ncbi:toxin [Streptomyces inusitatus]|uniref:Toxin n=1 Tax=Streptomyces inusitatus TaxID=68221 RepID=A0A918PRZ7_9ACTN|nr:toxin [Streptomyces inusitatus]